ncbi:catalase family protein [Streptomyces sp. NPDC053560]|uniref:catalase family protein n=1 Tax=Streptomyces sp. NPDC053560 TaxID=3365711 RepID=UPI0037CD5D55
MSPHFIAYTPDVESVEPDFDENVRKLIATMEQHITGSMTADGNGRALREAHSKGYGLVRGEVEILGGLPAEYAQGIYATPGRHDALVRFSNGSARPGPDSTLGGSVGLALKMFGIDGPTLLEDEPDSRTFDCTTINAPVFFCSTVRHYLFVQELFLRAGAYFAEGRPGQRRFFRDYVTGMGTLAPEEWAWEELLAFLALAQRPLVNVLLSTYTTMGAVRHGDHVAKVRLTPDPLCAVAVAERSMDPGATGDFFRPALVAELRERPYAFRLQVQLCTGLDHMPVDDLTVEWPEWRSPYVTVARLRLPAQDISGADNLERMDALSFTPWRVTAAHRPLGSIMRARKEAYRRSSVLRHRLNHQERREPRTADEVLPLKAPAPKATTPKASGPATGP